MFGRLLALVALSSLLAAAAPQNDPSPLPINSPAASCPPSFPATVADTEEAFANDLRSRAVRRFLTRLESATRAEQDAVLENVTSAARDPETTRVARTVAAACTRGDGVVGLARAVVIVQTQWTIRGLEDVKKTEALSDALATRIGALVHANLLAPADLARTEAPFAPIYAELDDPIASPAPAPSGSCAVPNADARVVHAVQPAYPPLAIAMRKTGTVELKVSLDDEGSVSSVTVYKRLPDDDGGSRALVESAIVAAATTTYAPEIVNCVPKAGAYLFRSVFKGTR